MTTETLTPLQIAFEIRSALGQAGATHFINAHAKSPEARLKAMDALTAIGAVRYDDGDTGVAGEHRHAFRVRALNRTLTVFW
jgi:hypothetical protein